MSEDHIKNLKKFYDISEQEIKDMEIKKFKDPKSDDKSTQVLKEDLRDLVAEISKNGEVGSYNWSHLRRYFTIAIKDSLFYMKSKYPDFSETFGETFEELLGDLIELFNLFDNE